MFCTENSSAGMLTKKMREVSWRLWRAIPSGLNVQINSCHDPRDNKFLEIALSGRATHLITGDADLLVLDPFQGIRILSPQEFLDLASPLPH